MFRDDTDPTWSLGSETDEDDTSIPADEDVLFASDKYAFFFTF